MKHYINLLLLIILNLITYNTQGQRQLNAIMKGFPSQLDKPKKQDHPDAKILGPALFNHMPPLKEQYSPTTNLFLGTDSGNLYSRNAGSETHIWSLPPESGFNWQIDNAVWSPNGQFSVAKQVDDRNVPEITLTSNNPVKTTQKKYSRAGQNIPLHQFYIIEQKTGRHWKIEQDPKLPYIHALEWNKNGTALFMIAADRLLKQIQLQKVDIGSGIPTVILSEKSNTYAIGLDALQGYSNNLQDKNIAVFLENKQQFTWMSERSGYNQIYLYDADGNLIRPLTNFSENGIVTYLEYVDNENGWIYFLAHGNADRPYDHQLYKTNLNSHEIIKIVDTPGVLELHVPSSIDTLWVLRSKLPRILQIDRYSSQGTYYDTAWKGDFSSISENYFNYEYITAKAADRVTDVHALILKPTPFDNTKTYPVVEYIYGANFLNVVPHHLFDPPLWEMNSLAQEGFITVFIDGRGTSDRGKKFKDFSYGKFGQVELDDHIAVLKQIAKTRPYMNMAKIGILGHSWGGHFALRALLEAPDFYKAGHINAPALEPSEFRVPIEVFMGCLPQDCPDVYKQSSIVGKLKNLKAPLMIVHGTNDDDVPIDDSYQLIHLLDELGYENYKFESYTGIDHIVMRNREWFPSMVRFFEDSLK